MYYPITIPYILDDKYLEYQQYTEEIMPSLRDFVICFWQSIPLKKDERKIQHIIVFDGSIDLIVDFDNKWIGYVGFSKTIFEGNGDYRNRFFGIRFKAGVFHELTGIRAKSAIDSFISLSEVDKKFDINAFFKLDFKDAKTYFLSYLENVLKNKKPTPYIKLFDELYEDIPETTIELSRRLHVAPRTLQRIFAKHYGLTPQKVLSLLRYQKYLALLLDDHIDREVAMSQISYYDQSHMIKDFKRHIGVTPKELLRRYQG